MKDMYSNIFKLFSKGRKELEDSISAGEFKAFSRLKHGHAGKYDDPWAQYQHVAGAVNNLIYEEKAMSGERVGYVKLFKDGCPPKIENRTQYFLNKVLDRTDNKKLVDLLSAKINDNPSFKTWFEKDGLKSIGIPLTAEKIPDEIIPLIDRELIISENLFSRSGNFLDLLGIENGQGSQGKYGGGCIELKPELL